MEHLLAAFVFGFGAAVGLVPLSRLLAERAGYVAQPSGDRWHKRPTPLLGGAAIFAAAALGAALFGIGGQLWPLLATGALIFLVGVTDDIISLKPSTKLIAEIAVASMLLSLGYRLDWTVSPTLDALLTLVWIVGVTNAFNLLDNMDGLCAGVALLAGATLLAGMDPSAAAPQAIYLAVLIGALGGFLVYNFNPASIFMGDSGSLFVGLTFAAITLATFSERQSSLFSVLAAPVLVLLVPIFDTTFVTVLRLLSGRSAAQGGRDHSSHRLVAIGLSERHAVAVLWTLAGLAGAIGLALANGSPAWSAPVALLFVIAMVIFAVYLSHVRVYQDADQFLLRSGRITPVVVRFMYKRRVAEIVLDVCLVSLAYYLAYPVRFDNLAPIYLPVFIQSLPIVLGVQMVAFFVVGVYRGVWRLFGLMDAVVMAKGVALGAVGIVLTLLYLFRFTNYSRGVFIIYAALLLLLQVGSRASFRLISEFVRRRRGSGDRLLIYGAGEGGAIAVRELVGNPDHSYRMLGFVDDDDQKRGSRILGYPVLSGYDGLIALIDGGAVDRVVISTRAIPLARVRDLEALCAEKGVALSRLDFKLEHLVAVS